MLGEMAGAGYVTVSDEGAPTEAGQEGVVTAIVLRGTCRWNHPGKKKAPR